METVARMEPCLPETYPPRTMDRVAALLAAAKALEGRLHPRTAASLADLVRIMNCYYSNKIEGHNTTLREIENALRDDFEATEERRNLQFEARAHIRIQAEIDRRHAAGVLPDPASPDCIRWLHEEFYKDAPPAMLVVENAGGARRMTPGRFRSQPDEDVSVGRHVPPSPAMVAACMEHFSKRYGNAHMGQGQRIVAMAAAHHHFNFIHPFLDGNGRVSRLLSHAMGLAAGIGAHGLWSISRGLARGLESRNEYRRMLDLADTPRRGDHDGRGNLSLAALLEFVDWFLDVCIDQVTFMAGLFDIDALLPRVARYLEREGFRPEALGLVEAACLRGSVPRGDAPRLTGLKERSARDLLAALVADGILASDTQKGPVRLHVTVKSLETLFPKLFPLA